MKLLAKIFLYLLLPVFIILFLVGGCSFKYIDPQYYEFLSLCREAGQTNFNQKLYEDYKNPQYKETKPSDIYRNSRILEFSRGITYFGDEIISRHKGFIYINHGVFLKGDEGAGWHWESKDEIGCKENNNFIIQGQYNEKHSN